MVIVCTWWFSCIIGNPFFLLLIYIDIEIHHAIIHKRIIFVLTVLHGYNGMYVKFWPIVAVGYADGVDCDRGELRYATVAAYASIGDKKKFN